MADFAHARVVERPASLPSVSGGEALEDVAERPFDWIVLDMAVSSPWPGRYMWTADSRLNGQDLQKSIKSYAIV
jgi:hypothetical protein